MRQKTRVLAALVAASSVFGLWACTPSAMIPNGGSNSSVVTRNAQTGAVAVGVQLPAEARTTQSVLDSLNTVEVTVSSPNWTPSMNATFTKNQMANGTAWKTFTGVQAGAATVYAVAKDASTPAAELATASADVTIQAGQTTNATLNLTFRFGDVAATINVTVTPLTPAVPGQIGSRQTAAAYVGSKTCQYCHDDVYQEHIQNTHFKNYYTPGLKGRTSALGGRTPAVTPQTCAACHATGANAADFGSTVPFDYLTSNSTNSIPNTNFMGIGCESCHGPGGNHVSATNLADRLNAIVKVPSYQTCEGCHRGEASTGMPARVFETTGATESDYMVNGAHGALGMNPVGSVYEQNGGYTANTAVTFTNAHKTNVENGCVTCHVNSKAGESHIVSIADKEASVIANVCAKCHGSNFNADSIANFQYQNKVAIQQLKDALAAYRAQFVTQYYYAPRNGAWYRVSTGMATTSANFSYVPGEWIDSPQIVKDQNIASASTKQNWLNAASYSVPVDQVWSPKQKLYNQAYWNYQLLNGEGSYGIHAPTYTQTLLRNTYNALVTALQSTPASADFSVVTTN